MILRPSSSPRTQQSPGASAPPAWRVFLDSQKQVGRPFGIIFQSEHSRLAGELAGCLGDDIFGPLPAEVIEAVRRHDYGWDESDSHQVQSLPAGEIRPFPALSAGETLASWRRSIAEAAAVAPLIEVLVSRHLCVLGAGDPEREGFVRSETDRRASIEGAFAFSPADLDRWTAALGFCDLLSLYLCAGCVQNAEFPLAHPASPEGASAPKVTLSWQSGAPGFSRPVMKSGANVSLNLKTYTGPTTDMAAGTLSWQFVDAQLSQQQRA